MEKSQSITELTKALVKFKASHPKITLNEEVDVTMAQGGKYKFKYASLPHIKDKVEPVLSANGLVVSQLIEQENKLTTMLLHASGEYLTSTMDLNELKKLKDGKQVNSGPQEYGSLVTYARRYAYCAILGIIGDSDDDANLAEGNQIKPKAQNKQQATDSSVYDKAKAEQDNQEKPWLNRDTTEWNEAQAYMTNGDEDGKPTLDKLLLKFRISQANKNSLSYIAERYYVPRKIVVIPADTIEQINKADSVEKLEWIWRHCTGLQPLPEFTAKLAARKLQLQQLQTTV